MIDVDTAWDMTFFCPNHTAKRGTNHKRSKRRGHKLRNLTSEGLRAKSLVMTKLFVSTFGVEARLRMSPLVLAS